MCMPLSLEGPLRAYRPLRSNKQPLTPVRNDQGGRMGKHKQSTAIVVDRQTRVAGAFRAKKLGKKPAKKQAMVGDEGRWTPERVEKGLAKLKTFDLDMKFGPCVGIGRLARWKRGLDLDLCPPREIHDLLRDRELQAIRPDLDRYLWYSIFELNVD